MSEAENFQLVRPFSKKCAAVAVPPGSKSVTNRAMVLSALRGGETVLRGALFSRDTEIMSDCLRSLGFVSERDSAARTFRIAPSGKKPEAAKLFVGNAGTVARFASALVATFDGGEFIFDSDDEMKVRPMKGLLEALKEQGSEFEFFEREWSFPFKMSPRGLKGGTLALDASVSSQILSAILMVGAFAKSPLDVVLSGETVSRPFVDMTIKMMESFGFGLDEISKSRFSNFRRIEPSVGEFYDVEPDATAAGYFGALPVVAGGACFIAGLKKDSLQGDSAFFDLLQESGIARVDKLDEGFIVSSETRDISPREFDFKDISDTFPTLAAIAPVLGGKISICGIGHTRRQECDRVSTVAENLRALGTKVDEKEDSLSVYPNPDIAKISGPVEIKTRFDHRMAMSFAVLGCFEGFDSKPRVKIEDPKCVSKTYPNFFDDLDSVRESSEKFRIVAVDGGAAVGKSSVSKACSKTLGYLHVDTGAHYRTLTYGLLEEGILPSDENGVSERLASFTLGTAVENGSARMTLNGRVVPDELIRTKTINSSVSIFAAMQSVRSFVKKYQTSMADFAKSEGFGGLIMEGRDIGNAIFPNADVKIFLCADEATRAARRAKEGISDSISERDKLDSTRKISPLKCAEDAVKIDTSKLSKDEVVARALAEIVKS